MLILIEGDLCQVASDEVDKGLSSFDEHVWGSHLLFEEAVDGLWRVKGEWTPDHCLYLLL